jgi:hypothetical protein
MEIVWLEYMVYSGWHPVLKGTWDFGVVKVIKGRKTICYAGYGKELQKTLQ